MDESKRLPPQPSKDSEQPTETTPSFAPSKEALAMIERAALAMADRKRIKRPGESTATPDDAQARTAPPVEPPEPFMVTRPPDTIVPTVTLKSPGPMMPVEPPAPVAADKSPEAKLIAEFDSLLGGDLARLAAPVETRTEPEIEPNFETTNTIGSKPKTAPDAAPKAEPSSTPQSAAAALRPLFDDQFRLSLSRLQSAGAAVAIFAFVVGASGLAAHTWVTAHDWTCRTGMMTRYCPPPAPAPKPPVPLEIPI